MKDSYAVIFLAMVVMIGVWAWGYRVGQNDRKNDIAAALLGQHLIAKAEAIGR